MIISCCRHASVKKVRAHIVAIRSHIVVGVLTQIVMCFLLALFVYEFRFSNYYLNPLQLATLHIERQKWAQHILHPVCQSSFDCPPIGDLANDLTHDVLVKNLPKGTPFPRFAVTTLSFYRLLQEPACAALSKSVLTQPRNF